MYETVLDRFPRWVFGEFYRILKNVRNVETFLDQRICSYVGELESLGQG